jgi:hypothetical protein
MIWLISNSSWRGNLQLSPADTAQKEPVMEKPILRTVLILIGVVTFSISAFSSAPARCLSLNNQDNKAMCLATAQLDISRCNQISNGLLQQQCQNAVQAAY